MLANAFMSMGTKHQGMSFWVAVNGFFLRPTYHERTAHPRINPKVVLRNTV